MTAIIDLDSVAYAAGNGVKLLGPDGLPIREDGKRFVYRDKTKQELIESVDSVMENILKTSEATHYIGYIKGQRTTEKRLSINPDYKAQRSQIPPTWWWGVKSAFITQWGAIEANGYEVDDFVLATKNLLKDDSFIVAIDKDLLSLEGRHYNWRTQEWIDVSKVAASVKFWTDMIVGQPIDNIKGIPGKGPKFTENLFTWAEVSMGVSVITEYVRFFGEHKGIQEFYKNYMSLKLLAEIPGLVPQPIPVPEHIKQKEPKMEDFL